MESLALHTGATIVHLEYNTSFIYVVEAKIVTPGVKHIDITVYFLIEQFDNGLFIPKYEKSSVIPEDMFTKPCPVPIISRFTKLMTGFRLYTKIDTEHYQHMVLHKLVLS